MTFQSNLLRQAGQNLRRKHQRFADFLPYFLIVFAFWIVCLVEWTQRLAGIHASPWYWMLISLMVTAYGGCQVFRLFPQPGRTRPGKRAERVVAELLERTRGKDRVVYHDLPGHTSNIDHLVIGAGGVFVVETKLRGDGGTIDYGTGDELVFGGKIRDNRPLRQARDAAGFVRTKLRQYWSEDIPVRPLLVFVGDWEIEHGPGDFDVDVVTAAELETYLDRQQPELVRQEIGEIAAFVNELARG